MNWTFKPTWRRVSFTIRIIIGAAGSLVAAAATGQIALPQSVLLWLAIIVIVGPGILSEISKFTIEEANVKINQALYAPSPLTTSDMALSVSLSDAVIPVPDPPEESHP